jgi:hypothetical protein
MLKPPSAPSSSAGALETAPRSLHEHRALSELINISRPTDRQALPELTLQTLLLVIDKANWQVEYP